MDRPYHFALVQGSLELTSFAGLRPGTKFTLLVSDSNNALLCEARQCILGKNVSKLGTWGTATLCWDCP